MTLNSNRITNNQGANMIFDQNMNNNPGNLLNQSLNISGNISSRRNSVKNQEFSNFLSEWKNIHYYPQSSFVEHNNESLNIVPEEIDSKTVVQNDENIVN